MLPVYTILRRCQTLVIRGSAKTVDQVLSSIQRPLQNLYSAVARMTEMLMTWSGLGGLEVILVF